MRRTTTGLFVAIMVGFISPAAFGAADPKPTLAIETPEDVVIRAKRMKLYELRMEMLEVEDKFYAKYNELNGDDDYDVVCTNNARTGEVRTTRRCEPVFVDRINAHYAADLADRLDPLRDAAGRIPFGQSNLLFSKWQELKSHTMRVINGSPELRRMVRHREALERSYKAEQKVRLNGRLVLIE